MGSTITYSTDLSLLSDEALTAATNRAWREASRCWAEARREASTSPVKRMLLTSAEAAEEWFEALRDEQALRDSHIVEVRSDDRYEVQSVGESRDLPDGGTTTLTPDEAGLLDDDDEPPLSQRDWAVSPWVTRADEKTLPAKVLR